MNLRRTKIFDYSKKVINTLKSTDYILEPDFENSFLIMHWKLAKKR